MHKKNKDAVFEAIRELLFIHSCRMDDLRAAILRTLLEVLDDRAD